MKMMLGIVMAFSVVGVYASPAFAEDMTGVTTTEIKVGNTMPYSGPAAPYGIGGEAMSAYFNTVNQSSGRRCRS